MMQIKDFVEKYYLTNRHSPSTREIAEALGIVKSTAYKYLIAMRDQGMIGYDGENVLTDKIEKANVELTSVAVSITLKFCTFFTPKKCTGTTDVSLRVNHLFPLNDNFHQLFLQL